MRREKISHGELIAHLVSLNNLEDINRHMSVIIDADFLATVQQIEIPDFKKPVIEVNPNLVQQIKQLFTRRHFYCHELAMKTKASLVTESDGLIASIFFVNATENMVEELIAQNAHR